MSNMSADRFCLLGRFIAFVPGEKSPYQGLSLETVPSKDALNPSFPADLTDLVVRQIVLGKDLRQMMYRYLVPDDWVRVVGKQVMNKRSGQMEWKAAEVSKLSPSQINSQISQVAAQREALINRPKNGPAKTSSTPQPIRVLICQKSDCRQRGSESVMRAIADTIQKSSSANTEAGSPAKIITQATGCLKRCKAGPNMVLLPGGSHSYVTPEKARSIIQTVL